MVSASDQISEGTSGNGIERSRGAKAIVTLWVCPKRPVAPIFTVCNPDALTLAA